MGNMGSNGGRRRNPANHGGSHATVSHALPHAAVPPEQQQQQNPSSATPQASAGGNRYVFAAATPFPPQYPNPGSPQYHQYPGYYPPTPPPMPTTLPAPFLHHHTHHRAGFVSMDHHHHHHHPLNWGGGGRYPAVGSVPPVVPYIEQQKAITIRNDVNLKKETLTVEPDADNPGQFLVAFTFDATAAGSITVLFFAKEVSDCNLLPMKESILQPITVSFKEGLGQKFRQPPGTGINFSALDEIELLQEGEKEVYPLAVKAEASSFDDHGSKGDGLKTETPNSQITQAVFEKKENGEYHVKVIKQILWVNGVRYELQEIYGIGNSVENDFDGNDPGKECVICLSEPCDTTVLPCRHMCMCNQCAKVLRFQTNRCPICRQPVERLLEIKVNDKAEEQQGATLME